MRSTRRFRELRAEMEKVVSVTRYDSKATILHNFSPREETTAAMKLRQPTDFLILEALEDNGRNVAPNLEVHTGKNRQNINTRMPVLEDYGLVEKIGPAERSGLYEITPRGKAALMYRDQYSEVDEFESLLDGPLPDGGWTNNATAKAAFIRGEDGDGDTDD